MEILELKQGIQQQDIEDIEEEDTLVSKIRASFEEAVTYKQPIHDKLVSCLEAFLSRYPAQKLAAIRELGGSEAFIPLTNIKCRACKAWLVDIFFQPNETMFDLRPTPVPTFPDRIKREMEEELSRTLEQAILPLVEFTQRSTQPLDFLDPIIRNTKIKLREKYEREIREQAAELCKREKRRIHDQFTEGGFYSAFSEVLSDISIYPTAIMKGPVLRRVRKFITAKRDVAEIIIPSFNRVSPFDAFPSPYMNSFEDGYFIELLHLTPQQLYEMIGVPGFDEDAIRSVLDLYGDSGFKETSVGIREVEILTKEENRSLDKTIDVIEFWGPMRGKYLKELGLAINDEDRYYDVCAWVVDNFLIKAMLNPDPLGRKPYVKASFVEVPDSFWGMALPEVIQSIQDAVNSFARATVNNGVLSSGALIERNIDRIQDSAKKEILPFQIFDVRESMMNAAPAYRFYQLQLTADRLMQVLMFFQKMADEYSGVPAYAHGDVTVGGAGRTAAGLSLLTSNAARGIKDVVKNIDSGIIEPLVEMQYFFNLYHYVTSEEDIPDLSISARGSINLMEREAQAQKLLQFLQITANPTDITILGLDGRKELLAKTASNMGLEIEELFAKQEAQKLMQALSQQMPKQVPQNEPPEGVTQMAQEARMGTGGIGDTA